MPAPAAYVFDAYGTLFDVFSAVNRLKDEVGPNADRLNQLWRTKQLEYTWIRSQIGGCHRDFWQVTGDALDWSAAMVGGLAPGVREKLMQAYLSLDAYSEVGAALAALRARGAKTAILSNGSPRMLEAAVRSAGLGPHLDAVLSIEEVGIYKPSMRVYELATGRLGLARDAISFQSSNRWDVAAAQAFGFRTVWINRAGAPDEYPDLAPARTIRDLRGLLEGS